MDSLKAIFIDTLLRPLFSNSSVHLNVSTNHPSSSMSNNFILASPYTDIQASYDSLPEFVWKDIKKWEHHVAIKCFTTTKSYKYGELRKLCRRFASALVEKRFRKGDVLAILLPNIPEYPIILLGTMEAGLVVTTLNPSYGHEEISRQLEDSESRIVVTTVSLLEVIQLAKDTIENRTKREYHLTVITLGDKNEADGDFQNMIDQRYDRMNTEINIERENIALMPYSSGTTGLPKGVMLTHSNIIHNLVQLTSNEVRYVEQTSGTFQEVVPAVLPFYHIFGISASILTSLLLGSKIVCLEKFEPNKYLRLIKDEKATVLYLVPTLSFFLTSHPAVKPEHLKQVRVSYLAGGCTPASEMEKLMQLSDNKMNIRHAYGLTEASPGVCLSISHNCISSVGAPLPSTKIKILGSDGIVKGTNELGEICVKGPQIMKGYFGNDKATKDTIDQDGFLHTGDLGYYDDEGYVFYVDRLKDLIKVKGFQVAPIELETILKSQDGITDVGVIGIPHQRYGQIPVAFVAREKNCRFNESELKQFVADHVASYKQLKQIIFIESIPRNASGKILRHVLLDKYNTYVSSKY